MDARQQLARAWLINTLKTDAVQLEPVSTDASFRRYFRVILPEKPTTILMDCPPEKEDCQSFIHVTNLLQAANVRVPDILAQNTEQGFLLLSDLGAKTILQSLKPDVTQDTAIDYPLANQLITQALDILVQIQKSANPVTLPTYDHALLNRELRLFIDWFLITHCKLSLSDAEKKYLDELFDYIIERALEQPTVFVHRDYMVRNLMVKPDGLGVIDFQDAVSGPITYDCASLLQDAFISWDEEIVLDWLIKYREKAQKENLPVGNDIASFYDDFEWMGLQRHLKVLGIFCRINYRDKKPNYLPELTRFCDYVKKRAKRYDKLSPLLAIIERAENAMTALYPETHA